MADSQGSRRAIQLPLLVALIALAAAITGLNNQYVQDDIPIIWQNPAVHSLRGIPALFVNSYWPPPFIPALYRPFASITYVLQWLLGGGAPVIFRIASYLLYAAVSVGVYRVARLRFSHGLALATAALFAAHPLHVEAVAVAVNQSELWVGLLFCVAVVRYLRVRSSGGPFPLREQLLLGAIYLAACLFKENALVLPGVLLAAEALLLPAAEPARVRLARIRQPVLILMLIAVVFFWVRTRVLSGSMLGTFAAESLVGLTMKERALTMLAVVPEWFRLMTWPAHLRADYSPSELIGYTTWGPLQTLGLALLLTTIAVTLAAWRRAPMISFGLAWYAIGLFPVHNVLAPTGILLAERTLFLPSIGFVIAMGGLAHLVFLQVRLPLQRLIAGTAALLVLVGIYRSNLRQAVWADQFTLWYRTANVDAPRSFRAHESLAETYFNIKMERLAEAEYRLAVQYAAGTLTRPTWEYADRLRQRGFCYPAAVHYREVIAMRPEHLLGRASLIACLLDLGSYREAMFHARMALTWDWELPAFRTALAVADSALRAAAPPGTVRVNLPAASLVQPAMVIGHLPALTAR